MQALNWQTAISDRATSVYVVMCFMVITTIWSTQNNFSLPPPKSHLLLFSGCTPTSHQNMATESVISHSPQETVINQPTENTEMVPQSSLRSWHFYLFCIAQDQFVSDNTQTPCSECCSHTASFSLS